MATLGVGITSWLISMSNTFAMQMNGWKRPHARTWVGNWTLGSSRACGQPGEPYKIGFSPWHLDQRDERSPKITVTCSKNRTNIETDEHLLLVPAIVPLHDIP